MSPRGLGAHGLKRGERKVGESELFLVTIYSDLRIQKLLWRPATLMSFDESGVISNVELIEKSVIVCDTCGRQVAVTEKDLDEGLPMGYALCDEECVIEVVCEDCRRKYFAGLSVYHSLDEALGGDSGERVG